MATQSPNPPLYGTGFSPDRGNASLGSIALPLYGGDYSATFTPTTITTAGAVSYTAAQCIGGFILRDTNGAGRTDVLPSAQDLLNNLPGATIGQGFEFTIRNTADANETITLSAGTGGTFSGTTTIAQNATKRLLIVITGMVDPTSGSGTAAYTCYSLGSSTF